MKKDFTNISIAKDVVNRMDRVRDTMSKAFGYTLSRTQFFELMIAKMEYDIKSKEIKENAEAGAIVLHTREFFKDGHGKS